MDDTSPPPRAAVMGIELADLRHDWARPTGGAMEARRHLPALRREENVLVHVHGGPRVHLERAYGPWRRMRSASSTRNTMPVPVNVIQTPSRKRCSCCRYVLQGR